MKKASAFLISILFVFNLAEAAIYQVTTTAFAGAGSISQAITNANGSAGKDTVYFSIPGVGPFTIVVTGPLTITQDILIDGTTQSGYNPLAPKPIVELRNSPAMAIIVNGGSMELRTMAINNCAAAGIILNTSGNKIKGCYVGLALDGITDNGNAAVGISISSSSSGNIIGGTTAAERNIISGNSSHGIIMTTSSGNSILGNYIGTNAAGTAAVGNSANGIELTNNCVNNKVGGSTADSSNIISGNNQHGVELNVSTSNKIYGNTIGLQADKSSALGNGAHGVLIIAGANTNEIGGVGAGKGNIISANASIGINIINSNGTLVKSNIIGTSANTQIARGNLAHCIQLQGSRQTIIGGDHATEGNILSAAGGAGINIDPNCNKTIVKGNYIGTDNTGTLAFGNFVIGIILKSDSCTIGGVNGGEGNIIVDTRLFCGLLIADANDNMVKGNNIGVGLNNAALSNKTDGINISVETNGKTASRNIVQYNTIAYNTVHGINVGAALNNNSNNNELNNDLRFNSIYCNKKLGISLNLINPADQGNNGKTAPIINNALSTSSKVVGLANGLLATDHVDIYEMSECLNCDLNPQGKKYVATVSPDAAGNWTYDQGTPITGTLIATATDAQGNTSQFSLCFTPCDAKAVVSLTEYSVMLEMNKPITISLNSSNVFSNLTTAPGKTFWSMGTADTSAPAQFSTANSVNLTFAIGGGAGSFGPGVYNVYLIAKQSGCADTAKVKLNLFFIPNMITPNGDQKNDQWAVGNEAGQFDAKIYNRWGDLVYSKSDYINEWDGSGLSEGVYYYLLEDKTQSSRLYKGWVQIVK
jgi:gliding motility-associated-like protein